MRVGVFHPPINVCGGAELVAVKILECIRKMGHSTILLVNEKIDAERMQHYFGRRVSVDSQIVFPFELFRDNDCYNLYSDFIRIRILKSMCDVVVDTYSNGLLPSSDLVYMHHPITKRIQLPSLGSKVRDAYFLPYLLFEKRKAKQKPVLLANSVFTSNAVKKFIGINPEVLYPPVGKEFFTKDSYRERQNTVVSVGRIEPGKNFRFIPKLATLTDKNINFLIFGLSYSGRELNCINELIAKNGVKDRVRVVTDISREELMVTLRSSKLYLHTKVDEPFGISLAEAMACGCMPVCHDSGGPQEITPSQFRYDSIEEAAKIINRAINEWSPKMPSEFSRLAEQFSEDHFERHFTEIFRSKLKDL